MQQNPHGYGASLENNLEVAIGRQARAFRKNLGMTVVEVSRLANLSPGMLSKIEHGQTSPSLSTLQNLAKALNVPVTSLFRQFEEERDASFVKAGEGIEIERRGTRAGHHYRLLGHTVGGTLNVEPYLITLSKESDVFPIFQHAGVEFVHLLEGALDYRHGDQIYSMTPGDSLFFDADAPHGPENLTKLPIKFLSIISYPSGESTD
ncbi:MAG: helix-turn-helix domain-containing protein [Rhodospirillaceae bacterium]|jgi:transcriptional regulator with XRE-family HTH domain|nr:helix-turn-helix domain-containing protein [Rhodospirillaceae bacterium]MBT5242787.1 helix-turn-helix domain-containing protein [Rhodospirillaceae bacterium]MBT5563988.1 helix-turn-helix domain-containing protein [Rhodospirillaceae bacterium]MBT6243263.1 helix-turn-helix domain-containing protein [Rhodospirillaceae bacterium]